MADTVTSPNMNLPVPIVGQDAGPQYATDVNSCLTVIDGHDHSTGSGVQITPNGLNINVDLAMNGNSLTSINTLRFISQNSPIAATSPNLSCLQVAGVDLYYNDGAGNVVRVTQNGGIAGSPGSISNLTSPASASYVSGTATFVWQSAANTPANMDAGSYILRNITANSKGLTLNPPSAMASDYSLVLPLIPAQTSVLGIDTSGNISAVTTQVDPVGANQVANSRTRATGTTVGVGGVAISAGSGVQSVSNAAHPFAFTDITNLSITITTTGRPVFIGLISDPPANPLSDSSLISGSGNPFGTRLSVLRGTTNVITQDFDGSSSAGTCWPVSSFSGIDTPSAGTYTYKVQWWATASGTSASISNAKLVVYEL